MSQPVACKSSLNTPIHGGESHKFLQSENSNEILCQTAIHCTVYNLPQPPNEEDKISP